MNITERCVNVVISWHSESALVYAGGCRLHFRVISKRSYGLAELLLKPVDNIFHLQIMILSF